MKNLVLILILAIGLVSCKKENLTPGNYQTTQSPQDTSNWQNGYSTTGNWSMTLNTFMPINGLTLSCSNFNANVFATCPIGGTIQLNLKDNFSNTNNLYVSTFKKI